MDKFSIPNRLNLAITLSSTIAAIGLLILASHTNSGWIMLFCAVLFSFLNNTNFSLLHEAVHNILQSNPKVNYALGVYLAAFFPTGFTFQRHCHLGHHQRNRSYAEQFDYYRPTDNIIIRYIQWYGILTGLYWCLAPLTTLIYLVIPKTMMKIIERTEESHIASSTGSSAMLKSIENTPSLITRSEILFTFIFQSSLFLLFGITWQAWVLCYSLFAINWSSLQYADHAWSKLDVLNGAWNLKVNKIVRILFLNYHHHLTHHQNPKVSWMHLNSIVDKTIPRPYFRNIYFMMWKGPKPIAEHDSMHSKVLKTCC